MREIEPCQDVILLIGYCWNEMGVLGQYDKVVGILTYVILGECDKLVETWTSLGLGGK